MLRFETTYHVGPDGVIDLQLPPEFANMDVRITVTLLDSPGPAPDAAPNRPTQSDREPPKRRK